LLCIDTPTQNQFLITILGMLTGIAFLIHGWLVYDNLLK